MPQRAVNLVLALAGVAAVALLYVIGADLARAAQRGPRWKRCLLSAGLALLAAVGISATACRAGGNAPAAAPEAGTAAAAADAVKDAPRVSPAATTEYARTRVLELEKRLAHLDKMEAGADEVDPMWIDALVTSTQVDVRFMNENKFLSQVSDADLPHARATIDRAAAVLKRLEAMWARPYQAPEPPRPASPESLAGKRLEETDAWKNLTALWAFGGEIAAGRRGPSPFNTRQREQLLADLQIVRKNVVSLEKAGLLSAAEAGLLGLNLDAMITRIQEFRPEELRMATCYGPAPMVSPDESVDRLAARLPLLEKLAAEKQVLPAVADIALHAIETDLRTLSDPANRKDLKPQEQEKAADLCTKAHDLATKVRSHISQAKE